MANEVDYTGASAQELLEEYTNRPEDAGTVEGLINLLSKMSLVTLGAGAPAASLSTAATKAPNLFRNLLSKLSRGTTTQVGSKVAGKAHDNINKFLREEIDKMAKKGWEHRHVNRLQKGGRDYSSNYDISFLTRRPNIVAESVAESKKSVSLLQKMLPFLLLGGHKGLSNMNKK
jgi:hypothetical protein